MQGFSENWMLLIAFFSSFAFTTFISYNEIEIHARRTSAAWSPANGCYHVFKFCVCCFVCVICLMLEDSNLSASIYISFQIIYCLQKVSAFSVFMQRLNDHKDVVAWINFCSWDSRCCHFGFGNRKQKMFKLGKAKNT